MSLSASVLSTCDVLIFGGNVRMSNNFEGRTSRKKVGLKRDKLRQYLEKVQNFQSRDSSVQQHRHIDMSLTCHSVDLLTIFRKRRE